MAPAGQPDPPAALTVRNDLGELARVADWINAVCAAHALSPRICEQLILCAEELVTNIVMHAYDDHAEHQIQLRLRLTDEGLAFEFEDDGRPFDPRNAAPPDPAATLETTGIGGWGIQLVRRFSDELRYLREAGRNRLTLVFHRTAPTPH